ncbi:hypothetical protein G7072_16325 [Nocardioides sp. HDW12B]|uniref:hypothetical protein n=1 Tax=Nocardioides sp. HDW12B TaxID=2714939 RepID=UPI00140B6109|nr:hypothetical protein [Nocardioides sp. HDW12B]QIK67706.1 hypothetical protein G7072_16325 [Nocardioides sp. HDW12B]
MSRHLSEPPYDDAELAAAIDASFGDGPAPAPLDELLLAGRRARRRRTTTRAAVGGLVAAGVLTVAAVSVGSWDLTGASGADGGGDFATSPSGAPTPAPDEAGPTPSDGVTTEPPPLPAGQELGLTFGPDGALRADEGTVVVRRLVDPVGLTGIGGARRTFALEVERAGKRFWVIAQWYGDAGEMISADPAGQGFDRFEDWLAHRSDAMLADADPFVVLQADGSLRPADGVELLAQKQDLGFGPRFSGPQDRTAAAEVRADGRRWYVLVRDDASSQPDYITVDPRTSAATFEGFLLEAAETYSDEADGSSGGYR